jgi:hypothetical protein
VSADELRVLVHDDVELVLDVTAAVRSWRSAGVTLVGPELPGSVVAFRDVALRGAWSGATARTNLTAACGRLEVLDRLETAEPIGRGAPGVALVRLVRCLDGPLDVEHRVALGDVRSRPLPWTRLNRVAFGYLEGCKITLDGGELDVQDLDVLSRLRADAGSWAVLTLAVDGHLPAEAGLAIGGGGSPVTA